jgi:hypothetical protein
MSQTTSGSSSNATATNNKQKKKHPMLALTAGCVAGGIEATAVWPMEYIKVRRKEACPLGVVLRSKARCASIR